MVRIVRIGFPFPQEGGVASAIFRSSTKSLTIDRWEDSKDTEEETLLLSIISGATDEGDQGFHDTNHKAPVVVTEFSPDGFSVSYNVVQEMLS